MYSTKLSLSAAVVFGVVAAANNGPVLAQEQDAELEEIVVTGSYLYTGLDSPSPVAVIAGEDLVDFAPTDLNTFFFDNVTQNFADDTADQNDNMGMARTRGFRSVSVNLRNLGPENTLSLVNGRRVVPYAVPTGMGWNVTDINSIVPRIAVGRADLLLDGGSATFGSDPVAGVVNLVTRQGFDGFEVNLDSRFYEEATDKKNITFAGLWGHANETTSILAALELHEEDRVLIRDLDGDVNLDPDITPETGTGLSAENRLRYSGPSVTTGMGMNAVTETPEFADPDCGNPALGAPAIARYPAAFDASDILRPTTIDLMTDCAEAQGFNPSGTLAGNNTQNILGMLSVEHAFTNRVSAGVEISVGRTEYADEEIWGDGAGNAWREAPATQGTEFAIPVDHPGYLRAQNIIPTFGQVPDPTAMGMGPPPLVSIPLWTSGETLPPLSEMDAHQESDVWRIGAGLDIDLNQTWTLSFDAIAGNNEVESAFRDIILENYPLALSGLGGPNCDPATGTAGSGDCEYFNPFLSSALPVSAGGIPNSPELLEWLVGLRTENYEMDFTSLDALVTGQFGELPGGPIGVAFGVGTRSEELQKTTDPISFAGGYATVPEGANWGGELNVNSAYFEFALPVHDEVDVQVAARYEDYDSGFSELTPKIAAIWLPTDNLRLRASIGTSFKGPAIQHVAGGTLQPAGAMGNIIIDNDEYGIGGMGGMGNFAYETVGNPNLGPQTSDSLALGFDWNVTDNISVGASWIRIEFKDQIFLPSGPQTVGSLSCIRTVNGIPADENDVPLVPNLGNAGEPLIFKTVAEGGCIAAVEDPTLPLTVTNIARVVAKAENRDFTNTDQLDLRADMSWDTPIGLLTFTPQATVVLKYELPRGDIIGFDSTCGPVACDLIGRGMASPGLGGLPRWRMTANTQLAFGNHNLRLTFRYTDAQNDNVNDLTAEDAAVFVRDDGLFTTDLNWSYRWNQGTRVSATIQNLSATIPDNGGGQFNRRRRVFSLQMSHAFGG